MPRSKDGLALALGVLGLAVAFAALRPVATPGPPMRDFEAYWAAGAAYDAGTDPYSDAIWRYERTVPQVDGARHEVLPFVGPPFTLPVWGLFARLPFPLAAMVWGGVLALAAVAAVFGAASLARLRLDPLRALALVLLGLAFGPLTSAFALGQVALVACAGIVAALVALRRQRFASSVAALLAAATQPNIALVLVARLTDRRACLAAATALAAAAGIAWRVAGGAAGLTSYLRLLRAHGAAEQFVAIQLAPTAIAYGLGMPPDAARSAGLGIAALVLAATVAFAWRMPDPVERVALACCGAPFVLPFLHEHDLVIVLLPVIVCAGRLRGPALGVGAFGAVVVAVDWLGLAQRPTGMAQSGLMALALALAFSVVASPGRGRYAGLWAWPVVLALGALAAAHPAPTWPDALPAGFSAPAHASIATVWELEQRAAGLASPEPVWALLRLLSLGGCGILWGCLAAARVPARAPLREPETLSA